MGRHRVSQSSARQGDRVNRRDLSLPCLPVCVFNQSREEQQAAVYGDLFGG